MANRYKCTPEIREKYIDEVMLAISKIEQSDEYYKHDFTGTTDLTPGRLCELVESLGYENDEGMETNGWQWDFWIKYEKEGCKSIYVSGEGMTFELYITSV